MGELKIKKSQVANSYGDSAPCFLPYLLAMLYGYVLGSIPKF